MYTEFKSHNFVFLRGSVQTKVTKDLKVFKTMPTHANDNLGWAAGETTPGNAEMKRKLSG